MEERLIELETKFSYQEGLLSDLNDIVAKQQRQLDNLITEMSGIKEQLQDAAERGSAEGHDEQDEKPPSLLRKLGPFLTGYCHIICLQSLISFADFKFHSLAIMQDTMSFSSY